MDSKILITNTSVTHQGKAAVSLFRAITVHSALKMYAMWGIRVNRAYTPTAMLRVATEYTGKTYKRGQYTDAAIELQVWIDNARKSIPVEDTRS